MSRFRSTSSCNSQTWTGCCFLLAGFLWAFGVPALASQESESSVAHMIGYEAAGDFRHVAGSACCHAAADPQPLPGSTSAALAACEQRCVGYEPCDVFVFSPSTRLCFLIRYTERNDTTGGPKQFLASVAEDRILGVVQHRLHQHGEEDRQRGKGRTTRREKTTSSTSQGGKRRSQRRRRTITCPDRDESGDCEFEGFDFIFDDCSECGEAGAFAFDRFGSANFQDTSAWQSYAEERENSAENSKAERCWNIHDEGAASEKNCTGFVEECWEELIRKAFAEANGTSRASGFEHCHADAGSGEGAFFSANCGCFTDAGASARLFREARRRVWPDREACVSECAAECVTDLQRVRRQTLRFLKKLLKRAGGKDQHTFIFDFGEEEQEALFCQDTCRGICEDFDKGVSSSPDGNTETCAAGSAAASAADIAVAANKTAKVLRGALERAGQHIRGATPALLLDEPAVSLGDLLGSGSGAWPSLADFAFGGDEQMHLDQKLLSFSGAAFSAGGSLGSHLGSDVQAFRSRDDTLAALQVASNGYGEPRHLAGSVGASLELRPMSKANLLKSLPSAARWAEGSPPFLDRLLSRAVSRLGGTALLRSAKILMR